MSALQLWTGVAVPVIAVSVALTIVWTALYGSDKRSHRAFRLLRYAIGLLRKNGR